MLFEQTAPALFLSGSAQYSSLMKTAPVFSGDGTPVTGYSSAGSESLGGNVNTPGVESRARNKLVLLGNLGCFV